MDFLSSEVGSRIEPSVWSDLADRALHPAAAVSRNPSRRASSRIFSPWTACFLEGSRPSPASLPRLKASPRCQPWRFPVSFAQ